MPLPEAGIMQMTMSKMPTGIKRHLVTVVAGVLATLILFFDVASVSAFNGYGRPHGPPQAFNGNGRPGDGRPSGPAPRGGQGYYRADPGPRNYRSAPGPGYYPGDRAPGPGPGNYQGGRGPRFYRGQPFSPYGGSQRGVYGERRAVQSMRDAQRMLNDYYTRRNMRIGSIRENRSYFEADILDRNDRFTDRVIIDKRSGRIRSIY
jgi:hypothetical protein